MQESHFIRVVALRKGKCRPVEFRIREKERGLSLFALKDEPSPEDVVSAVRSMGKQGELSAAAVKIEDLHSLGLRLVRIKGETPAPEINAIHWEARLPLWRQIILAIRGIPRHAFFNEVLSPVICEKARLLD